MYKRFISQPHQPFFTSGILFFILFLLILSAYYSNLITINVAISKFHSYPLIHIVFIQFFLGFLFVVFPRFLIQPDIKSKVYMGTFYLLFFGGITYVVSLFVNQTLSQIAIIILIVANLTGFTTLFKIYKKSIVKDKYDVKWILVALFFAILSNILFFLSTFGFFALEALSIYIGFYIFLFGLIFTMSQRMIPFFSQIKVSQYTINRSKYILEITFSLLILKVLALTLDIHIVSFFINLLLFLFFTYELLKWRLPIFKVTAIMWILYLALFWIPIGFLIFTLQSASELFNLGFIFQKSAIHALSVGYFVTILIGFGTRVVLGHSNRVTTADLFTIIIFWFVQIIVLTRIFAGVGINGHFDYIFWILTSANLLLTGLIVWSFKYMKILIKG